MQITLKNLKIVKSLSEETLCFCADVYIDGKKAFAASNRGHGGCNDYHPYEGNRDLLNQFEDWCAAQPPIVCDDMKDPHDKTKPFTYKADSDHFINEAIQKMQVEKEFKKDMKRLCILDNGQISTFKVKADDARGRAHVAKVFPKATILNDLPEPEAFAHYNRILGA